MSRQVCNNCGQPLGFLEKGHIHDGKVVCLKCIKLLDPDAVKPKVNYARIAVEAIDRATEQPAEERNVSEDIRYERAKRRVVFFFSGIIWFLYFVIVLVIILSIPVIIFLGWMMERVFV